VESWLDWGDTTEDGGLEEWPEVCDMRLDGGVAAGLSVEEMAVRGEAMLAVDIGWWASAPTGRPPGERCDAGGERVLQ
jgi:hypothetical protein